MEIMESIAWVTVGFLPTLALLEVSCRIRSLINNKRAISKKGLGIGRATIKGVPQEVLS
jgi:hypothetical protein